MRNKKWLCMASVALIVSLLAVVAPAVVRAADPIKLNYSIFFPAPHKNTVLATEWAQEIEKRTNGAVRSPYSRGELSPRRTSAMTAW
jgi:TRAP-type C4-dicarboxylate transport system substrate-binding protein